MVIRELTCAISPNDQDRIANCATGIGGYRLVSTIIMQRTPHFGAEDFGWLAQFPVPAL
jgi:hypothetical protein